MSALPDDTYTELSKKIKIWGQELGFQQVGIADINLESHKITLQNWLDNGYYGDMHWITENTDKRLDPAKLVPGTLRVVSVCMAYLPDDAQFAKNLKDDQRAYISRYATGRDYHKVMRNRLKKLGEKISELVPSAQWRPFVDSAPVLEHALAEKAGIGWTGKHSLTLNSHAGSLFFLGELFINLPLPTDTPTEEKCGSCVACITVCPTKAIVAPYVVDGRRCISYLTIENKGDIPEEFRRAIGNRIYGCDDCQLICPWNRYAQISDEPDFKIRHNLSQATLLELFAWDESTFLNKMQGSAIRRIGFQSWQRNISIALGNAQYSEAVLQALQQKQHDASALVQRHIDWAIAEQLQKKAKQAKESTGRLTLRLIRTIEKGMPDSA
ncbi:tRNA epoxyqueuosine(34) reductase QueG [Planctobacterium marinum]|uniref:tRNA epoxyqueuosine(34) reductase QueG n=1 Tax=Planctobacterium marinum TaxID=1631968 RepID=UPI001E5612C7|nr:tRNA epoxyqueuosine(34) reductase QueG [Planctobacterium marinum]MCC2606601.1 tRNA epoxyqueuosine(34) reductase QueG [Planctobacterium marinum]